MTYTKSKPTGTGYFWMKDASRGVIEQVVEITSKKQMGVLARNELMYSGKFVRDAPLTTEWAGPISKPTGGS